MPSTPGTPLDEVLSTLNDLVRRRQDALSSASPTSPAGSCMKSLAIAERHGYPRYVAHQVYYSLVGRDYEWELMPLGLDQGVGAMVWSPLGWGRLTGKIRRGQPLPEVSRLHETAEYGPPVDDERLFRRRRCARGNCRRNRKTHPADRPQLAAAAPDGLDRHHWRPQRGAAPRQPRGGWLVADTDADGDTGRRQRRDTGLPLLPLSTAGRLCTAQPPCGMRWHSGSARSAGPATASPAPSRRTHAHAGRRCRRAPSGPRCGHRLARACAPPR